MKILQLYLTYFETLIGAILFNNTVHTLEIEKIFICLNLQFQKLY